MIKLKYLETGRVAQVSKHTFDWVIIIIVKKKHKMKEEKTLQREAFQGKERM